MRQILAITLLILCAAHAHAQSRLSIDITDAQVTLVAENATLRAIMREWEQVGAATIVNLDQLDDRTPLTLRLTGMPYREALKTVLRSVSGFVVALRPDAETIDRIVIAAESRSSPIGSQVPTNREVPVAESLAAFAPTNGGPNSLPENRATSGNELGVSTQGAPRTNSGESAPASGPANVTRVPTPILRPSTSPDAKNPFGRTAGSATPGTISPTGPPPGFVYPPQTNPNVDPSGNGTTPPR